MNPNSPLLLTDEQMRRFITDGFLILKADFSDGFHERLVQQLNIVYEQEGNPGNNLLPRIPDIQKVLDHPVVSGALTSVLGPNYLMHAHRHGHYNASPEPGRWHKDSYWGYKRMRNHHPWWAMIMYFPQDTPMELGPTGIMPGTQNYETRTFEEDRPPGEFLASGTAGTFALIHYDIWHRSTSNCLGQHRYMLKFEFMRTQAPTEASWNHQNPDWVAPLSLAPTLIRQETMWEETWSWLTGQIGGLARTAAYSPTALQDLSKGLQDSFEPYALHAAYELARGGQEGVEALLEGLHHPSEKVSRVAAYGLAISGAEAIEGLLSALESSRVATVVHSVFALGELRQVAEKAVPYLIQLQNHSSERVRQAAVEAIGMIGVPTRDVVYGLTRGLQDSDVQVRFMAALSLARLGPHADEAVPQLKECLEDGNRYVRAHAVDALHYIGTDRAKDVLIPYLLQSRWCPSTTKESLYYP